MRYKLLACKVMAREIGELSSVSKNIIDITWIKQGYHNEPEKLREILQQSIDRIDNGNDPYTYVGDSQGMSRTDSKIDAIILGYGLCSNGIVNVSSKYYPIVIPRAHDCITLFLGSKERYSELFNKMNGGAYWYTTGWVENTPMPSRHRKELLLQEYIEKYGEDNAEFLLETESGWYKDYTYAAYVSPHNPLYPNYAEFTKDSADFYGWNYAEEKGDISLLKDLLEGNWDEDRFLIVPPGKCAVPSYDNKIITVED